MLSKRSLKHTFTRLFLVLLAGMIFLGCRGQETTVDKVIPPAVEPLPNPYEPRSGDGKFTNTGVDLKSIEVIERDSHYLLLLTGTMPTPCHELRVDVSEPDAEQRIMVEIYALYDAGEICVQVIEEFEAEVPLPGYVPDETSLIINGQPVE